MYFPVALVLVALPFLTQASSVEIPELRIPLSKRSTLRRADGVVDITRIHASRRHTVEKIKRGLDAFERNTGEPHPLALKMRRSKNKHRRIHHWHQREIAGQETLAGMWYGLITVGTPPQNFTVELDTGSSDLLLPDATCNSTCDGHHRYYASQSSTAKLYGDPINLGYGDSVANSSATAQPYKDTVTIAGYKATGQMFVSANMMAGFDISYFLADGLLGMADQSLSQSQDSPVIESLVEQGQVLNPIFSLYLADSSDSESELFIGGVNESHYTGEIAYVPVDQRGYWQITIAEVEVNGKSVVGNTSAIVDSGTSIILCKSATVHAIHENIPGYVSRGDGTYTFPCDTNVSITMKFGDTPFQISPKTLSLGPESAGSDACISAISVDDSFDMCTLGDPFLLNVYTVFDLGNNRVGFASLPPST